MANTPRTSANADILEGQTDTVEVPTSKHWIQETVTGQRRRTDLEVGTPQIGLPLSPITTRIIIGIAHNVQTVTSSNPITVSSVTLPVKMSQITFP